MKRIPLSRLAWVAAAAVLLPAITFADDTPAATTAPATTTAPAAMAQKSHASKATTPGRHMHAAKASTAAAHRIDLNSATREDLMTLPGIDGGAADKIIAGRPWKSGPSLVEKNVLTKADYAKLKTRIMAKHVPAPAKTP